jgi:parallel beta-helix repeat protein
VVGTGNGNVIEENLVAGNTNGIYLSANSRNTVVRQNTIVGNPAVQVGNSLPLSQAADILNLAPPGANTFDRNTCVTAVNAPCPDSSPLSGWRRPPG